MNNARLGIPLMIATTFVFAVQDGLSQYLAREYNTVMVVMIRYWFFALFVMALSATRKGGIRRVAATSQPFLQISMIVLPKRILPRDSIKQEQPILFLRLSWIFVPTTLLVKQQCCLYQL